MKLLFVLVMLTAEAAGVEDLSGKMFTFPMKSKKAHVRLNTNKEVFNAVTVCHRSFTDLTRAHVLFSMSTNSFPNQLLIFWEGALTELEAHIKDQKRQFKVLNYTPYTWHSVCTTWDSVSGFVQMWFNGLPLGQKFAITRTPMTGTSIIILGQEQDSHGGGFDDLQAFVGMMSDVHMWDYALSTCEIQNYTKELNFTAGNVLNWRAMDYQITDRVVLEDKMKLCH